MRRLLFAVLASSALIVALPAAAMARHGDGRRHEHHHRVRHDGVRHERRGREHDFPPAKAGDAGTVQSFNNGVLVIMLGDGMTVSGRVTNATELRCESPEHAVMHNDDHGSGGSGGGDQGDRGGDHGDRGDDRGQDEQMCATGSLTTGAMVHEAELRITSFGAFWEEVEVVTES
jgi:hypothetical protein